ncbi:MAG: hypothetical protein ACRD3J_28355 [Thermoanaerobaculia bacterium]
MFCPQCHSEYRPGIAHCSDCDVPLVSELKPEQQEHFGNLLPLAEEKSADLVADLLDRLEKAEVPYVIEAGTALAMLNNEEIVLDRPQGWEARVWIPAAFSEQALRILSEVDAEYGRRRINMTSEPRGGDPRWGLGS